MEKKQVLITLMCIGIIQAGVFNAKMKHPVRQDIVEEIKAKATTWKPMEVHENLLSLVPADDIQSKLGFLGAALEENSFTAQAFSGLNQASHWMSSIWNFGQRPTL